MYVDLLCPSSSWQYIAKPRLYNCNLAENRSGVYYTSKLSNCSECFKFKRQIQNNPRVRTILFHYLAHKFTSRTPLNGSFAAFAHLHVQFVVTNPRTKRGWQCRDTGGDTSTRPGKGSAQNPQGKAAAGGGAGRQRTERKRPYSGGLRVW